MSEDSGQNDSAEGRMLLVLRAVLPTNVGRRVRNNWWWDGNIAEFKRNEEKATKSEETEKEIKSQQGLQNN